MSDEKRAVVLFAHGSRDPRWAEPFRAIQRRVADAKPGVAVEVAFLEIMEPTLSDTVERLARAGRKHITIAPLFMAQGAHVKRDLAAIVANLKDRHPELELALLPAAGEADDVLEAISSWVEKNA